MIRATARVRSIFLSLFPFIWRSSGTRGIHVEKLHVTNRGACMIAFPITFPWYWIIQLVSSREREIHGWHQMVPTWERDCQYVFNDWNFYACTEKCVYERNDGRCSFCLNLTLQCALLLIVRHIAMRETCIYRDVCVSSAIFHSNERWCSRRCSFIITSVIVLSREMMGLYLCSFNIWVLIYSVAILWSEIVIFGKFIIFCI